MFYLCIIYVLNSLILQEDVLLSSEKFEQYCWLTRYRQCLSFCFNPVGYLK